MTPDPISDHNTLYKMRIQNPNPWVKNIDETGSITPVIIQVVHEELEKDLQDVI